MPAARAASGDWHKQEYVSTGHVALARTNAGRTNTTAERILEATKSRDRARTAFFFRNAFESFQFSFRVEPFYFFWLFYSYKTTYT